MTPNSNEPVRIVTPEHSDPRRAALSAMNAVAVEATGIVRFATAGRVLVIGTDARAVAFAGRLPDPLKAMTVVLDSKEIEAAHPLPVFHAQRRDFHLGGHLGDFRAVLRPEGKPEVFDMVVDFSPSPILAEDWARLGYYVVHADTDLDALIRQLEDGVGEFEKPRYFGYDPDLCVRGRSGFTGCNRCVQACPAGAITGLAEQIEVDPHLCQGGGICTTVCPGGALQYRYPSVADSIERVRTLVATFRDAGGRDPELLLHDEETQVVVDELPANLLPFAVEELASVGMEFWLASLAFGVRAIHLQPTPRLVAASANALEVQLDNARALLAGLGYPAAAVGWLGDSATTSMPIIDPATFAAPGVKREILFMALDHLVRAAPDAAPAVVELPPSAPLGEIRVDAEKCTLCVSCATVCPRGAITAEEGRPALVFFEARCVQCGLCEQACPERAITLGPRLLTDQVERNRRRVLHEEAPFECTRCGKPFATRSSIESVLARLEGHSMFTAEAARDRLKMCGDCRVIDMMQEDGAM